LRYLIGILLFAIPLTAFAEPARLALVIGNSEYVELNDLPNPNIDALSVHELLLRLGYSAELISDASSAEIREKIKNTSLKIKQMPTGSIFLLYYAGHGFEEGGQNFVLPADGTIERGAIKNGIKIGELIRELSPPEGAASYFFFDACRTLPVISSAAGFVRQEPSANTLIAFSADAGSPAADGIPGAGSPFAIAFHDALASQRGVTGPELMEIIQLRMPQLVDQTPVVYSNLSKNLVLNKLTTSETHRRTALAFKAGSIGLMQDAYDLARRSAGEGDVDAMMFLVINLSNPKNTENRLFDLKEAHKWAKAAYRSGDRWGRLGYANFIGNRVLRGQRGREAFDGKEVGIAMQILQQEAANGIPLALGNLGRMELYKAEFGLGNEEAARTAIRLLSQALDAGHMYAAQALGGAYRNGLGVERDRNKAASYYKIAYDRGLTSGSDYAFSIWSFGREASRSELDQTAFAIFEEGARKNDIPSIYGLAKSYYFGVGTRQNRQRALELLDAFELQAKEQLAKIDPEILAEFKAMRKGIFVEPRLGD
jgi:TPR repeat protein